MPLRKIVTTAAVALVLSAAASAQAADSKVADAAEKRDTKALQALITQRADVNVQQPDGGTALHWAAHWNDVASLKRLLAAGARPNLANDYGVTPLFLAATNGSIEATSALLDAGADPQARVPSGETVLMTAVRSGSLPVVKRLLAAGADPNAAEKSKGQTALMWAAIDEQLEVSRALIAGGADVRGRSTGGFTPLLFAARAGSAELSDLMLDAGADINASAPDGSTPILVATVRGHARLAMSFLEQGAKPDGDARGAGYTPLHWASSMSETPVTYRGLEAPGEWRAIPGVPDPELRVALINALLDRGADIEARITKSMYTVVAFEVRSRPGGTPFLTAASSGDAKVMRLLVARGADPLARASDGSTPMMVAAGTMGVTVPNVDRVVVVSEEDRVEAVKLAWELGNGLEDEDRQGYRTLHIAASAGFKGVIDWMVKAGADINAKSKDRMADVYGKQVMIPGQTPRGVADGYFGGALFSRPDVADYLGTLGGISIGKVNLENYIEQQVKPGEVPPARTPATAPR